jgi:anti-sigma regulatory factor (Ser/Thr protein kinase)
MTAQQALGEAKELYIQITGESTSQDEIPTQAEMVMAIVEIARFLIKHANAINP